MTPDAIKALAKAQSEMGKAMKDSKNPHFNSKYADLSSVRDACVPALNDNGFAVIQTNGSDAEGEFVKTIFAHESGGFFETPIRLRIGKNDMQGYGSAMTYARRFGLMSLAGLAPEDDDGNAAAKNPPKRQVEPPHDPRTGEVIDAPRTLAESATSGLRDAWLDGIKDSLPPDYTPRQMYEGVAKSLESAFASKRSAAGVIAQWDKRSDLIEDMRVSQPDLFENVFDAYTTNMRKFEPDPSEFMRTG